MPVLEYDIRVTGAANVNRAIAGIEQRLVQSNTRVMRQAGARPGTPAQSPAQAAREAQTRQRQIERQLTAQASLARQRTREERAAETAVKRTAQERQRSIDKQFRSQQALTRQRERETRAVERHLRAERNVRAEFARSTFGGGLSRATGAIRSVGAMGVAAAGIGGAAIAASAVSQATQLDEITRRLSIAGRGKGQRGVDPEAMRKQFTQTGIATGFAPERIAAGAAQFVAKTGDIDTALKNQGVFATVAQGSGANVEDVFSAAADLSQKLDISSVEQMSEAFAILSTQGKKGAFELKAMSAEFPEVLAGAASAGVKGIGGVRDVGAIMQIARQASGSDSEASTAVQTMFRQLGAKAGDIQSGKAFGGGAGVQVFEGGDAKNPMRNFSKVVGDILERSGGDITQLQDIFDVRGIKAVNPMIAKFREASSAAGGGAKGAAAGREAIDKMFGDFRDVSGDYSELQRDAADAMKSFSVQMEIFNTQLKDAVASQIFPELVKLAPSLKELIPHVTDVTKALVNLVKFFAESPFLGIGAVVAAAIVFEIAKAGLGAAVSAAVAAAIARAQAAGGGGMPIPGLPGGGGKLAMAGRGLAGGLLGAGVGAGIGGLINGEHGAETGAFVGGGGMAAAAMGLGPAGAAAGAALGLAADQATALHREAGGWDFWNFDENLNEQARAEAKSRQSSPMQDATKGVTDELANLQTQLQSANAELAKLSVNNPNRTDVPSGVKPN